MTVRGAKAGFTLIEIMVALAILATSVVILLDSHYGALNLFANAQDEAMMQSFMQQAAGEAEVNVLTRQLSGTGDFGSRYPDYSYSYAAQLVDATQAVPLYHVTVTVTGPSDEAKMELFVYNVTE